MGKMVLFIAPFADIVRRWSARKFLVNVGSLGTVQSWERLTVFVNFWDAFRMFWVHCLCGNTSVHNWGYVCWKTFESLWRKIIANVKSSSREMSES